MELYHKILEYFSSKGCQHLQVNASGMGVFYQTNQEQCTVYWVIELYNGTEVSNDQYQNIERQIETDFLSRGYQKITVHAILCTKNADVAMKLCRVNKSACIVDMLLFRLMLFEGQAGDESGIFRGLDQLILEYERTYHQAYANTQSSASSYQNKNGLFSRIGVVTLIIIAINAAIFLYMDLFGDYNKIISKGCIFWPYIKFENEYYRLLTYQFLHANISHVANNMLILAIMGSTLERHVGKIKYLLIYFLSGIVAGIASMSYNMEKGLLSNSIGASGAVFGVIGAIALIVIVNKGRLETIGTRQIIIFIALSLYGGFTSQGVDNAAHVGGLLAGFFIAMLVYRKKRGRIRED